MSFILASKAYVDNSTTVGDPVQIRDLTVACDGSGGTDGIIVLNWQAAVQRVDVRGCGGSGIVDTSVTQNGSAITNTSVNSRFENDFISNSGEYGFQVRDPANAVTDGFFTDNQVAYSGTDGVRLENSGGWVISANHLYGDGSDGIDAARLYGATISGNYIEDFGAARRPGTWYGIAGTAQAVLGRSSPATRSSTTPASYRTPAMSTSPSRPPTTAPATCRSSATWSGRRSAPTRPCTSAAARTPWQWPPPPTRSPALVPP